MRARRNVRDYERLPARSEAHLTWAAISLMPRRLDRTGSALTRPVRSTRGGQLEGAPFEEQAWRTSCISSYSEDASGS